MSSVLPCFLVLVAFLLFIIAKYRRGLQYWKQQNVDVISLFYMISEAKKQPLYQVIEAIYCKMYAKQEPFRVLETFIVTAVLVQDQEAIKDILITQFEHFADRGFYVNQGDTLLGHMARLEYKHWRPLRRKLTPAFSPTNTKCLYPAVAKVCEQFVEVLAEATASGNQVVEMYDLCSRFAIDVIGNVALGIECNSLRDSNSEFKIQAYKAIDEHFRPLFQLTAKYSKVMQFFNVKYHSDETTAFFTNLVKETMAYREKYNIRRPDFMDILIELKNDPAGNADYPLTLERIVAQVFLFFAAGFNSSSTALCQALYELAKNQTIQDKARAEALQVLVEHDNKLSYESIKCLKYTKQIVLETLRKYPLQYAMPRCCRHPCTVRTSSGSLTIQPNTYIVIPVRGIHHNPDFYPEPEIFRPERFDDLEKATRPACSFLPFGAGPKSCVAENFSLTEMTAVIAALVSSFRFSVCEKTPKEMVFDKQVLLLSIDNNIYLKLDKLIQ